ncbi:MAG: hypothetical protein AAB011_02205 [Candidatus Eisenbacteria bacterium]
MKGPRSGFSHAFAAAVLLAAAVSIVSCGSGERTLGLADPLAAPLAPTYEQAKAILDTRCVGCHGGGGDSELEPGGDDRDYSSCAGIIADLSGILSTSVDGGSMPPGALPRLTEREKLILTRWIAQGAHAPCNP